MLTNTLLHSVLDRREDILEMIEVFKDSGADVWVLMNTLLTMSQQCALAARGANPELHSTKYPPLYSALVRPHLKCCVQFWAPPCKRAMVSSESKKGPQRCYSDWSTFPMRKV